MNINKNEMFENNMGLVWKVIRDLHLYETKDMELNDYFQIGSMGLLKAIDTYKEGKGQFSTYATSCIKNEFRIHFREMDSDKRRMNAKAVSYNNTVGDGEEPIEIIDTVIDFGSLEPFNDTTRTTLVEAIKTLSEDEYAFFKARYIEAELTDDITNKRKYTIDTLGLQSVGEFKSIDRKVRIKLAQAFGINYDPRDAHNCRYVDEILKG